jgi:hypothetical protein
MIDREKIQVLAQINQSMLDAAAKLEEAIRKGDADSLLQLKSYITEAQKKFNLALEG